MHGVGSALERHRKLGGVQVLSWLSMCTGSQSSAAVYCVASTKRVQKEITLSNPTLTLLFVSFPCRFLENDVAVQLGARGLINQSRQSVMAYSSGLCRYYNVSTKHKFH